MSNTQLTKAADLIRSKRYKQARALLLTIDHPASIAWLAKIEILETERNRRRRRLLLGGLFVLVIITGLITVVAMRISDSVQDIRATINSPLFSEYMQATEQNSEQHYTETQAARSTPDDQHSMAPIGTDWCGALLEVGGVECVTPPG